MILHEFRVPGIIGWNQVVNLVPLGDMHCGTKNFDEDKLLGYVKYIKDTPNVYWIGMGDYIEAINYTDPRFEPDNIPPLFRAHLSDLARFQAEYMSRMLMPIKDKCIGLLSGNHESKLQQRYHIDVVELMAYMLKTINLSPTAFIRLVFHRTKPSKDSQGGARSVVVYAAHGNGGGGTTGASINKVKKLSDSFDADIYLMGHTHKKIEENPVKYYLSHHGKLVMEERPKICCNSGTFYKTYISGTSNYAEKMNYAATRTGTYKIKITPFRRQRINGRVIELAPDLNIEG